MIFINKTNNEEHKIFNQVIDLDFNLITNVTVLNCDNGSKTVSFQYGEGYDDKLFNLPFIAKDVKFVMQITDNDIYPNVFITFLNDKDYQKFEQYCNYGTLDFPVRMSQEEKIKLLIYLLKNT